MGKNRKYAYFLFSLFVVVILSIIFYPRKDDNKSIIKKSYALNIKNDGETSYTSVDTIPSDLTNYHIDEDKTICENGGKVSIVGNKLAYQTLGSDRCSVYLYYEEIHDIKMNVTTPSYLLSGYTKSITNCSGTNGAVWDYKLNGIVVSDWNDLVKCDISFTQKTPTSSELLSIVVDSNGTSTTHGIRYQGKNPDNYIWFNDELWRIIGNVPVCLTSGCASTKDRIKIIRNDLIIGGVAYGSNSTWMGSNIQNLLNTGYLGKKSSCDSYCYSQGTSAKGTCDYSSDGIDISDYYGQMVEDVYFNVGVPSSGSYVNADDQYTKEIASYASTTSKIGLMYASDWGYAIEGFSGVLGSSGSPQSYSDKNWLFSNGYEWTMSAYGSLSPLSVATTGYLTSGLASSGYASRPVLYLKSGVYVTGGRGTKVDPYRIGI